MIVDTSALVAVAHAEPGWQTLRLALVSEQGLIPAPVLVEFHRVVSRRSNIVPASVTMLIAELLDGGLTVSAFEANHAWAASEANQRYRSGGETGGKLNMLDLMVYGFGKITNRPILCTGKDFARTDALIHPASRID